MISWALRSHTIPGPTDRSHIISSARHRRSLIFMLYQPSECDRPLYEKREVAIKIIDTNENRQSYVLKNLTREAKLLSMLQHPCIVRLYETIQCGSVYYLVTELATGGDLCTHIKKQPSGRLNENTAKFYARQLVAALEHMHCRGIVHRDLKMDNIMLQDSRKERIKIVDFGLSNICKYNELLNTHCGSPEYAAPELFIDGKKYGPEVDLWSLGVVFYVMTSGRLPFVSPQDGHTPSDERRRKFITQINRGLTSLQEKNISAMSNEYKDVVSRLLMPIAHKRITIQELNFHPWILDRKNSWTKINSESNFDPVEHTEALDQVAHAAHLNRSSVQEKVSQKKFGDIGGMYNITVHGMLRKSSVSNLSEKSSSSFQLRPSVRNSLIDQTYKMMPSRPLDFNESMKHLFPVRETPSPIPFVRTRTENFGSSVNPPKPISGIIRRERHVGEHQKEYSRSLKKSTISAPQGNRIVRNQMPLSTISRPETAPRADLITQRRSQRLASNRQELPTSKMFLKSGVKLLASNDFVQESATVGNKTFVFYKPAQHPQTPQAVTKTAITIKATKKEHFRG
ncbi:SNF1-related protein kinase catalytic subunit alpha KIN12-like [Belonocnema kinseyi]|uniref:SNF1-related protein kinase catalytic subunit alpha KIN12-like n=1 Tax=Belonocnema kinseyi TaxID=2817044 RepID=UPI00143DF1BC|nr:SNF1-related protein kinase catalytic subunit alpha KIN12-like [Belonocnema kinseyi]